MRIVALIPAAGQGRRLGAAVAKQYLSLGGTPILVRTLRVFEENPLVNGIVLAVQPGRQDRLQDDFLRSYPCHKLLRVVAGGAGRQESVARALEAVPAGAELVVIHDGVRPLLGQELLSAVIEAARRSGAALAAVPVRDTVKQVEGGLVRATLDRSSVWLVQTPQAFSADLIRRAHEKAASDGIQGTDDAALVERLGIPVEVVTGSEENIKVTTPADLIFAEAILAARAARGE